LFRKNGERRLSKEAASEKRRSFEWTKEEKSRKREKYGVSSGFLEGKRKESIERG
jgi:hypothetical protein